MIEPQYIHLTPDASLEAIEIIAPFAAIVTIGAEVSHAWRHMVSEWLIEKGCLYMMAHGHECSLWDDSVDEANLEAHNWKRIPEEKSVTTTWHDDESIEEVFYFALNSLPFHPNIKNVFIFDISSRQREHDIMAHYMAAQDDLEHLRESSSQSELGLDPNKFPPEPIIKNFFKWILDRLSAVL